MELQQDPNFYIEMLLAFNKRKKHVDFHRSPSYHVLVGLQPIWANTNFMPNKKCLFFQEWIKSGILFVKDLINENGMFKTDAELFELIPNRQNIFSQILMIRKYVMNKFKNCNLSTAKYTKKRLNLTILINNKIHDVSNQKGKFFYNV